MIWNLLHEVHDAPSQGHKAVFKTYQRVKALFYWSDMKEYICEYVHKCLVY